MKRNLICLSAGVILLMAATLFDINFLNYEKPVPHSKWETISFHDFKGLKKPFTKLGGVSEFAFIKTSRQASIKSKNAIEIITWFHPSRSYVFNEDIRNLNLLRHELYHFHIAEYVSRLFRKEISSCAGNLTDNVLSDLSQKYYSMEELLQIQYDSDSYHSYIMSEQKNWEKKVDDWLTSLNDFSEPVVYFKNKE